MNKNQNVKSIDDSKQARLCGLCKKSEADYTCPRCNITYCSIQCYRDPINHMICSESFYQEQVIEELKQCKLSDAEERNKMVQILKQNVKELERESLRFCLMARLIQSWKMNKIRTKTQLMIGN